MITSLDYERINMLLNKTAQQGKLETLENKLHQSAVVDSKQVPSDVVTMNSHVLVYDLNNDTEIDLRLVYQLSPLYGNQTSILAPLGTALLGMRLKEIASFELRNGTFRQIKIEDIIFQPEALGLYHL